MSDLSTDTSAGDELRAAQARLSDLIDAARLVPWLRVLNGACARPLDDKELASRGMAILVLVGDLPAAAFTVESARRVKAIGFPSASAIRTAVAPAVKDMHQRLVRMQQGNTGAPGGHAATPRERSEAGRWVSYYRRRMAGTVTDMPRAVEAHLLSLVRAQSPAAFDMILGASRETLADEDDRAWWEQRIRSRFEDDASPEFHRNPTMRWREASGMIAALTTERAHVKQWAVDRLFGIMRLADDEGADTTEISHALPRVNPRAPAAGLFGAPERIPFSDRRATQEARASAVGEAAALPRRAMSRDQLAAAYAAGGTQGTQFRAAQLSTHNPETPDA